MSVLRLRTYNYMDALAHLLNTGDCVVLDRCAWSGTVFARTLKDVNLVSQDLLDHYWEVRSKAFSHLMRPHIVIYLDLPADQCLENARKNVILFLFSFPINLKSGFLIFRNFSFII